MITGASRGIGKAAAYRICPNAGAPTWRCLARSVDDIAQTAGDIGPAGAGDPL